jgi:hypothetical protein
LNLDHLKLTEVIDNPIFARFSNVSLTNSYITSSVTGDCINVKNGGALVENCTFSAAAFQPDMDAIDYDGVANGVVRNNVIHDFRGDNNDGLDIGEQCQNLSIEGNFIYHCLDKGISVGQKSSASIRNNVIAYTGYGIALKDQSPVSIDHCTFFGNQQAVAAYEKNPGDLGGIGEIKNCIASNAAFASFTADQQSSLTLDRCQTDTDTLSGSNLFANPLFINPTRYDFNLQPNSQLIGAGTDGLNIGALTLPNYSGHPQLMFSEILYDDTLTTTGEYIEILNPGQQVVDLQGYTIANAIDFTFPTGVSIAPGEYIVVAADAGNFTGAVHQVFQWADGKLADEGEPIELYDATGLLVDYVRYDNHLPWPERSTLLGKSLELASQNLDNHFSSSWRISHAANGSAGSEGTVSGTHLLDEKFVFQVFPNPASTEILVSFEGFSVESGQVRVVDALGRIWIEKALEGSSFRLDLVGLPQGVYSVLLVDKTGKSLANQRIIYCGRY